MKTKEKKERLYNMDIMLEKSFEINNLISRSGKFAALEFQKVIIEMVNAFKVFSIANGEYVITTTKSLEVRNGEQVMDVEILIPVNYRMPVEEPYVFKNEIKLSNCLYSMETDVSKLQDTLNNINQYIIDHKLLPITSAYLVQTKRDNQPRIEIYMSINPNIL